MQSNSRNWNVGLRRRNRKANTLCWTWGVVMDACSEFMPGVCGEYLAKKKGPGYEVVVGDAFVHMDEMKVKQNVEMSSALILGHRKKIPFAYSGILI